MKQEELEQYHELLKKGIISEEEYAEQKKRFFESRDSGARSDSSRPFSGPASPDFWGMSEQSYIVFMHVSVLFGTILPLAGFILPLIMWLTNKDKSERVHAHGTIVMNWVLSSAIYFVVSLILIVILIGIPLLWALGVCNLIFSIIGAVKASNGELWPYPLSIQFIK
jgi:uncharacterized Tic20 family protein